MRRSALVLALLSLIGAFPAYGQATQYTITFKPTAGSPTPTGSFSYNPANAPNSFANFLVMWDGLTFDFTSVANTAGAAQIFNNPICANGVTGAAAAFYLLTQCPEAEWIATGAPASSTFAFVESDTGGANLFDLAVTTTRPPTNAASAQGNFVSSIFPGVIYIADSENNRIRMVNVSGIITTVAGNGTGGYSGDGGQAASAELHNPYGVAADSSGNLYIADTLNNRIRMVTVSTGIITTVAGNGAPSYSGDNGPAVNAGLNNPTGVAVDTSGNIYIADQRNNRIRMVSHGTITTVAGNGIVGNFGDGGPATSAELYYPTGIAVDGSGDLFIADTDNQKIRGVSSGTITTVVGSGTVGYNCNIPVAATSAGLHSPTGVATTPGGALYIAASGNQCVWTDSGGTFVSVVGNGIPNFGGDGRFYLDPSVELNYPTGVVWAAPNNLYIADSVNQRIRAISPSGIITTFAGSGTAGFSGDGGPATGAQLYQPTGVAIYAISGSPGP
jgi:hypothetical protein